MRICFVYQGVLVSEHNPQCIKRVRERDPENAQRRKLILPTGQVSHEFPDHVQEKSANEVSNNQHMVRTIV